MKKNLIYKGSIIVSITIMVFIAIFATACSNRLPKNGTPFDPTNWETTFYDGFDDNQLNNSVWRIHTFENNDNKRRGGYYSADNILVNDGNLVIRTNYRENGAKTGWYTGWVDMEPDAANNVAGFSQKYGYFEVRAMAPPTHGIWSAAWLMPTYTNCFTADSTPASAGCEIDIMESPAYASKKSNVLHVLHSGDSNQLRTEHSKTYNIGDMYTEYHTYAVEWTDKEFTFYIDNVKTWTTKYQYDGKVLGTSQVLQHLLLTVEVASEDQYSWTGNPNNNSKTENYDYLIDYVKIMQRKDYLNS